MRSLVTYKPNNSAFTKINKFFSKILPKQKNNLNSIYISIKRNNIIKKYNLILNNQNGIDRFEEAYNLYIEALNDYIMNKIYKKVKLEIANDEEKNILSNYYYILKLKEEKYEEYSIRKQKYLLMLDYKNTKEEKIFDAYNKVYLNKVKEIYNKLLEIYDKNNETEKILTTLEEYVEDYSIEELILETNLGKKYIKQMVDYNENDIIKKIQKEEILLDISKTCFKDIISEETNNNIYKKIIGDLNNWLNQNLNDKNFKEVYNLLLEIIRKYNSNECNPTEIEKNYILNDNDKYIELEGYLNKKIIRKYKVLTHNFKGMVKEKEIKRWKEKEHIVKKQIII